MNQIESRDRTAIKSPGRLGAIALAIGVALGAAGCDKQGPQPPAPAVATAPVDATVAQAPATVPVAPVTTAPQSQPVPQTATRNGAPVYAPAYPPVAQVQPQPQVVRPMPVQQPVARAPVQRAAEVVGIEPIRERQPGSGAGAVIGGVLGAVVGNHFGHGNGRAAMTVLGAGGGAVAGNSVERNINQAVVGYRVRVQLASGATQVFEEQRLDGLRVGDRVRVEGGRLRRV